MNGSLDVYKRQGRLSAKDIMGNKKKLTWWQDEFWKHMVKKFPDLELSLIHILSGMDVRPAAGIQQWRLAGSL